MSTFPYIPLIFSIITITTPQTIAAETCNTTSYCSSIGPPIRFPFQLNPNQTERCGYPGFNLTCKHRDQTIIAIPQSGDFLVRDINYKAQTIQITDPNNCLLKRFMMINFNLSASPFEVLSYENYTLLNCSSNTSLPALWKTVGCLSGEEHKVVIARRSNWTTLTSCMALPPVIMPSPWLYWSDDNNVVQLMWSEPNCGVMCEMKGERCGFKDHTSLDVGCFSFGSGSNGGHGLPSSVKYGLILGLTVPAVFCMIGISCYIFLKVRRNRAAMEFTSLESSSQPARGLGDTTIASFPKRQLGQSRRLPKASDNTCPICLSEYLAKENLRIMPECKHYFHAQCIDEWLKMKGSCPLCRDIL